MAAYLAMNECPTHPQYGIGLTGVHAWNDQMKEDL